MKTKAKILALDIETAPNKVYSWGLYEQNINTDQIIEPSYVLCWAAKWMDKKDIMSDAIINYPKHFKKNPSSDLKIAQSIWDLLDEADIVVTHNGNKFDLKWLNYIFLKNNIEPPSSFKSIDTYRELRNGFYCQSYKLDYNSKDYNIGQKVKHEGFNLWPKCMRGDKKAWKIMLHYCKHDVKLAEELYKKLRPYMKNHPNLALYSDADSMQCPNCASTQFKKKGFAYTAAGKYQRYICKNCGVNVRDRKNLINGKDIKIKVK